MILSKVYFVCSLVCTMVVFMFGLSMSIPAALGFCLAAYVFAVSSVLADNTLQWDDE